MVFIIAIGGNATKTKKAKTKEEVQPSQVDFFYMDTALFSTSPVYFCRTICPPLLLALPHSDKTQ
jgi:hypothetical protein